MNTEITAKVLSIHTTTVCTLRCAKCGNSIPEFQSNPYVADIEKTKLALGKFFKLYDYVTELRFAGAEAFLYSKIEELLLEAEKYKDKFSYGIIVTNGTYIPKLSILTTIKRLSYPMVVRVDNYGELSIKYDELLSTLQDNQIQVDVRTYTNEHQDFDGWVDLGNYTKKGYSSEKLLNVFHNCRLHDGGLILVDDRLIFCCRAAYADMLKKVQLNMNDFILLSTEFNIDEMRMRIKKSGEIPYAACNYCNGFDPVNSPRLNAAEQLA